MLALACTNLRSFKPLPLIFNLALQHHGYSKFKLLLVYGIWSNITVLKIPHLLSYLVDFCIDIKILLVFWLFMNEEVRELRLFSQLIA